MIAVIMRRNGDREKHSYLLGVWNSIEKSASEAGKESVDRGGKYFPEYCVIAENGYCGIRFMPETDIPALDIEKKINMIDKEKFEEVMKKYQLQTVDEIEREMV